MGTFQNDPLVREFELGTLNIIEFNHHKHLYIAWCYLKDFDFEEAVSRYAHFHRILSNSIGALPQFDLSLTRKYFELLDKTMKDYPTDNFDELVEKSGILNIRITA